MGRASDFFRTQSPASGAISGIAPLVVPAEEEWLVQGVLLRLVTSATAGQRIPAIRLFDSVGSLVFQIEAPITGNNSTRSIGWTVGATADDTITNYQIVGMPPFLLRAGESLRVVDSADIDGADGAQVRVTYLRQFPGR